MARSFNPKDIDTEFILARKSYLQSLAEGRNTQMDKYERMYKLDPYEQSPKAGEYRVSLPIAHDVVESTRAMQITRLPLISVPTTSSKPEDQNRAQKLERYLYGVASRTGLYRHLFDAEWYADCLGQGWLKYCRDPEAFDDDFPIMTAAIDPRSIYVQMSPRKNRPIELVHCMSRRRGDIEDEWSGFKFEMPGDLDAQAQAEWLDGDVEYTEYWLEIVVKEKVEEKEPEFTPPLTADLTADAYQAQLNPGLDTDLADYAAKTDEVDPYEVVEDAPKEKRKRVRKVIHACIVEDNAAGSMPDGKQRMVKKAVVMPGYNRIPFVCWSGISTPMSGADGSLSVLFPLGNGSGKDKSMGVLATQNALASIDLQSAMDEPTSALFVKGAKSGTTISMESGTINFLESDGDAFRLPGASTNNAVMRSLELMDREVSRVGMPAVWNGTSDGSLSGAAISGYATKAQMKFAFAQTERQSALELVFDGILRLTKEYASEEDGWTAYGVAGNGKYYETVIKPEDIGDNYRVQVKLSAALPKDTIALLSMYSMLTDKKHISKETFLDVFQKTSEMGLASESPEDEMVRILRDEILMSGKIGEAMATALGKEYVGAMGDSGMVTEETMRAAYAELEPPPAPPALPQGPPGMPPQGPAQMGPGQGMPPQQMGPPPGMVGGGGVGPPPMPQAPQPATPPLPPGMTPEMLAQIQQQIQGGQ